MQRKAFTLIELLIVVAIIAILAAIAVPNFLEAQTRSKVSRVKADMRSLATAIEAYAVDNNKYPFANNGNDPDFGAYDRSSEGSMRSDCYEREVPYGLTTPISYISSLFNDSFPNLHADEMDAKTAHPFHYVNEQDHLVNASQPPGLDQRPVAGLYTMIAMSQNSPTSWYASEPATWMLLSHGPDVDHDNPDEGMDPRSYDPTNGSVSSGDVFCFGPGLGFK